MSAFFSAKVKAVLGDILPPVARIIFMIATLVALAFSAPDTLAETFANAGFNYVASSSTSGVLRDQGTEFRVLGYDNNDGLAGVTIARMVRMKRYVSQKELALWAAEKPTRWDTFLDHRVMASAEISLKKATNKAAALKSGLTTIFNEWKAFDVKFPIAQNLLYRQWHDKANDPPLNDRIIVNNLEERDIEYLARQKGWTAKNGFSGSTPGWAVTLNLNGETAYVLPTFQEGTFGPGFEIMTGEIEISAPFVSAFISTVNKKMRQAKAEAGATDKAIKVRARFSLTKPVEVRAVVAFIQEFGIDLATLRREIE